MASRLSAINVMWYVCAALLILGVEMLVVSSTRVRKGAKNAFRRKNSANKPLDVDKLDYDLNSKYKPGKDSDPWTYKDKYTIDGKRQLDKEISNLKGDITYFKRNNLNIRWEQFKFHINLVKKHGRFVPTKGDYRSQVRSFGEESDVSFGNKIRRNNNVISKLIDEKAMLQHANRKINT